MSELTDLKLSILGAIARLQQAILEEDEQKARDCMKFLAVEVARFLVQLQKDPEVKALRSNKPG